MNNAIFTGLQAKLQIKLLFIMKNLLLLLVSMIIMLSCQTSGDKKEIQPLVIAPFEGLDTLATNDWWNRGESQIIDMKVERKDVIAFGIYTVANNTLKLSAQLFPLYPDETREVRLEIKDGDGWKEIQKQTINDIGWSALFRVESWDNAKDTPYRLRHGQEASFEGLIRKDPKDKDEIVVAALSCNSNKDRGPRTHYVSNINHQDPDLIFFAGD
jgi:hypothetical protein